MKLALGTAQLGLKYGVANVGYKTSNEESLRILRLAKDSGITYIDTAAIYGNCEEVLGRFDLSGMKIVTKLPQVPPDTTHVGDWVDGVIKKSLVNLRVNSVYGLLLHRPQDLLTPSISRSLVDALICLRAEGTIEKIGVSIYDPSELVEICKIFCLDIVQAPLNLVDRRLEMSGWLKRLHKEGVEIHVRSVFLQGLLLMPRNKIPDKFMQWSDMFDQWSDKLRERNISAVAACLAYPLSLNEVDKVIVGVDSAKHLEMIINEARNLPPRYDWSFMTSRDLTLIDPSGWASL